MNAKLILQAIDDLEPLCVWMNDTAEDHSRSVLCPVVLKLTWLILKVAENNLHF